MKCIYNIVFLTSLSLTAFSQPYNYSEYSFDTVLIGPEGSESKITFRSFSVDGLTDLSKGIGDYQQQIEENKRMLQINNEVLAERKEKRDKYIKSVIKNQKIAYFTEVMELTESEGSKFWPVYLAYEKALETVVAERQVLSHKIDQCSKNYSANDERHCSDYLTTLKKESDIARDYFEKFKKILPPKKLLLMYNAELEFKKLIFRKFRGELF